MCIEIMDIFQIDASAGLSLNRTNGAATIIDENTSDHLPEVSFDAGPEFNLNFFDNPDDSNTQGGYSDPGSVESTVASSSPPPPPLNSHLNTTSLPPPVNQFHANGQLTPNNSLNGHTNGGLCGKCLLAKRFFFQPNERKIKCIPALCEKMNCITSAARDTCLCRA